MAGPVASFLSAAWKSSDLHGQADRLRNNQARKLMENGSATIAEILGVAFGHWPPKGVQMTPCERLDKQIRIIDEPDKEITRRGNYNPTALITMNSQGRAMDRFFYSVLAHEGMHALQHASWEENYKRDSRNRQNICDLICRELRREYPVEEKTSLREAFAEFAGLRHSRRWLDYAGKGIELQARILQLMADGYPVWGRLPSNKAEFQAALISCGLPAPQELREDLRLDVQARAIDKVFLKPACNNKKLASDVKSLLADYPPEAQEKLWGNTLPALYEDMLTMMGADIKGRAPAVRLQPPMASATRV